MGTFDDFLDEQMADPTFRAGYERASAQIRFEREMSRIIDWHHFAGPREVGRQIRVARLLRGDTLDDVAARVDNPEFTAESLDQVEQGDVNVSPLRLAQLAEALEVPSWWLLYGWPAAQLAPVEALLGVAAPEPADSAD